LSVEGFGRSGPIAKNYRPPAYVGRQLAARLAEKTGDGQDLIDFVYDVWKDKTLPMRERQWAFLWIAERLWGKAPDVIEMVHSGKVTHEVVDAGLDFTKYTADEMRTLIELLQKGEKPALPAHAPAEDIVDAEFEEADPA
jgi:hypothetical protein